MREAVITGYAAVTALGRNAEETFDALCASRSGIEPVRVFDAGGFECACAACARGLDAASLGIPPREARAMDFHGFGLTAVCRAVFDKARLADPALPRDRLGLFAGMGVVDYRIEDLLPAVLYSRSSDGALDYGRFYAQGYQQIHPLWPLRTLNNMAQAHAAIQMGMRGDNVTFSPQAEAGAQAVREAEWSVLEGASVAVIAAGISDRVCPQAFARHQLMGWLSRSGRLLPFGDRRDGTVLGEGAAALVFEEAMSARDRGQPALGRLAGYAARFADRDTEPSRRRAVAGAMREALRRADLTPEDLGVVFANGDGGLSSDAAEARALAEMVGDRVPVTATKAALGNTLAASSPMDAALALVALRRRTAPPCVVGPLTDGAAIRLVAVAGAPIERPTALVNVQTVGGQCASMVLHSLEA